MSMLDLNTNTNTNIWCTKHTGTNIDTDCPQVESLILSVWLRLKELSAIFLFSLCSLSLTFLLPLWVLFYPPALVKMWCWQHCEQGCCQLIHLSPKQQEAACLCSAWVSGAWREGWCRIRVGGARQCVEWRHCNSRSVRCWSRTVPTTGLGHCAWCARRLAHPTHTRPSAGWHTCALECEVRWSPPIPTWTQQIRSPFRKSHDKGTKKEYKTKSRRTSQDEGRGHGRESEMGWWCDAVFLCKTNFLPFKKN